MAKNARRKIARQKIAGRAGSWLVEACIDALCVSILCIGLASALSPTHAARAAEQPLAGEVQSQQPSQPDALTPAAQALPPTTELTRIAFGSCMHQAKPQPIWHTILRVKPQLLLMMGDNVYGDFDDASATNLKAAYAAQSRHPDFSAARAALPMLAIWDDHDFGKNDGGGDFAHKDIARSEFSRFWGKASIPAAEHALYSSQTLGPDGRRIQIIMLDTRSFRSPLKPKSTEFPFWGRYEPDLSPDKTMLGSEQWAWLETELTKPVDLRVIVSSIQVLAEGHGFERWGNLPMERDRLLRQLAAPKVGRVILLSGDRHAGAIYASEASGREIVEVTSSSINMRPANANQDARIAPLVSDLFIAENFGLIEVDWNRRTLTLKLVDLDGHTLAERSGQF
ncbi:MAG: alkaline phosphatase D family protein [Hyphomicrobium sp.]|jgi:alkaline phosphatase D